MDCNCCRYFFAGYVWFGKIQDELIAAFNDTVIDLLEQEERIFTDYVTYLEKYYAGEEIDMEQMDTVLNALLANHRSISGRMKQPSSLIMRPAGHFMQQCPGFWKTIRS
jgi:hypothetical protein